LSKTGEINEKSPTSRDAGPDRTGERAVGRSHCVIALPERPAVMFPVGWSPQ